MAIRLTREAAALVLESAYAIATKRAKELTPARAAVFQSLATRLGFSFADLASITSEARFRAPEAIAEREAVYLAAAAILRQSPKAKDIDALDKLTDQLDLGVGVAELDRIAAQQDPFASMVVGTAKKKKRAAPAQAEEASRPARSKARSRPAEGKGTTRRRKPGGRKPGKGGRREPSNALWEKLGIPPRLAIGGVVAVVALIAFLVFSSSRADPQENEDRSLATTFKEAASTWNRVAKKTPSTVINELAAVKKGLERVVALGDGGSAENRKMIKQARELLEGELPSRLGTGLREYKLRLDEQFQEACNSGALDRARGLLADAPEAFVAMEADWLAQREEEVAASESFMDASRAFLGRHRLASDLSVLREGYTMYMNAGAGVMTPEYGRLKKWFAGQSARAPELLQTMKEHVERERAAEALPDYNIFRLIYTDMESYLQTCALDELLVFAAIDPDLLGQIQAELLATLLSGQPMGTGFYVTDRYVVTNSHVVGGLDTLRLRGPQGEFSGTLVAVDPDLDLALIEASSLGSPLGFGGDGIAAGRPVYAFGFGDFLGKTDVPLLTAGIISAVLPNDEGIVVDTSINPGNSGGPLVDAKGRWLGVVVAKSTSSADVDSRGIVIHGATVRRWLTSNGLSSLPQVQEHAGGLPSEAALRKATVAILFP